MRSSHISSFARACAVLVGVGSAASVFAQADGVIRDGGTPTIVQTRAINDSSGNPAPVVAAGAVYSNVTNFTGSAFSNGGFAAGTPASGTYSTLVLDDLNATSGGPIGTFRWSLANLNTSTQSISAGIRFYADNGANAPGTFLAGFNFNPISLPGSTVSTVGFTATGANQFTIPAKVWAGVTILANGTATSTVLNNEGQGLYSPPNVGTSLDEVGTVSSTGAPFTSSTPAATVTAAPFAGNPAGNFGWELVLAPEPGSAAVVGMAGLALMARRRSSR